MAFALPASGFVSVRGALPPTGTPVREALDGAVTAIAAGGCETPRLDAELLLALHDRFRTLPRPSEGPEKDSSTLNPPAGFNAVTLNHWHH